MKKAKIYIPTKTAMQSGRGKTKTWILKFQTKDNTVNPLMGWESGEDTMKEVILEFSSKDKENGIQNKLEAKSIISMELHDTTQEQLKEWGFPEAKLLPIPT